MKKLAKELKKLRKNRNITQKELSEKIGLSSPQYISNVERGRCVISAPAIKKISKYLKISPEPLIKAHMKDYETTFRNRLGA